MDKQLHRIPGFARRFPAIPACLLFLSAILPACGQSGGRKTAQVHTEANVVTTPPAAPQAAPGTLQVMTYNVLKYGDQCQGPDEKLHGYLHTIVGYANPDILGLVKVAAIKTGPDDKKGAPPAFADSILRYALNAAFPGRYACCPATNKAAGNNMNLLFYDQHKLGYLSMVTLCSQETDFNMYRLYYKDPDLARSHDTAILYIIQNHTESGDKSAARDRQMAAVMGKLTSMFRQLPDMIDMGDFNLRNSQEPGYRTLVAGPNGSYRFSDPPFNPDHLLRYPADWEESPDSFARFLTTSTRKNEDEPNSCGTGGGAKSWYDHILLSPSVASGSGRFRYVANSYHTIGNDGDRIDHSVNAKKHRNTAVPPEVADALFQMSNKYPVMATLSIGSRR